MYFNKETVLEENPFLPCIVDVTFQKTNSLNLLGLMLSTDNNWNESRDSFSYVAMNDGALSC